MSGERILIVDDDSEIVKLIKNRLSVAGYKIEGAYDGEDGLEKTRSLKPDLLIIDVLMPKMTGPQVVGIIRAQDDEISKMPIIVISAKHESKYLLKDSDIQAFIPLPFEGQELLSKVKGALQSK